MELITKLIVEVPELSIVLIGAGVVIFLLEGRDRDPVGEKKVKPSVAISCLIVVIVGVCFYVLHLLLSGKAS